MSRPSRKPRIKKNHARSGVAGEAVEDRSGSATGAGAGRSVTACSGVKLGGGAVVCAPIAAGDGVTTGVAAGVGVGGVAL